MHVLLLLFIESEVETGSQVDFKESDIGCSESINDQFASIEGM